MGRKFHFEWRIALLTAILLPVMVSLGLWQLRRADENRGLMRVAEQRRQELPVLLTQGVADQLEQDIADGGVNQWHLKQVSIHGEWLDKYFLLENQMQAGRNGYYVVSVMRLDDGRHLLVNRGWTVAPALRSELPVVSPPASAAVEQGEIYASPHLLLEEPVVAESGWPRRIGRLNVPGLAHELGIEVLPAIVRLHEGAPSALTAQWPVVNISPEKNIAYAIQWFAMSVALVLFYLALSFRREVVNEPKNEASNG